MSLVRTALRIAAVSALNADPTISALCAGRVYDSRIDELDARDPVPTIVVYTEDDTGRPWSVNNGGPPFDHQCDLLLELSMRVVTPLLDPVSGQPLDDVVIGVAETDAEAEAALDLMEERAVEAVTIADTPEAALIRANVLRRATELKSIRFASADSGSKLALRIVTLTTHLKIHQEDVFAPPPTGPFALLPEPLRAIAEAQPDGSSTQATCLAIAAKLTPASYDVLTGIDATVAPQDLDPAGPPDQTDPLGPEPFYSSIEIPS